MRACALPSTPIISVTYDRDSCHEIRDGREDAPI